jgi:hypothetical protein
MSRAIAGSNEHLREHVRIIRTHAPGRFAKAARVFLVLARRRKLSS